MQLISAFCQRISVCVFRFHFGKKKNSNSTWVHEIRKLENGQEQFFWFMWKFSPEEVAKSCWLCVCTHDPSNAIRRTRAVRGSYCTRSCLHPAPSPIISRLTADLCVSGARTILIYSSWLHFEHCCRYCCGGISFSAWCARSNCNRTYKAA